METQVQAPIAPVVEAPKVEAPAPVVEAPKAPAAPDLVTRVSQFKTEEPQKQDDGKFNINDLDQAIEKLPDPNLKDQVLGLKKSLLRGENQKYQEIANLRKEYETKLSQLSTWTPERVQGLLKDPNFVNAAQSVVVPPQGDTSMLSEPERKMLEDNNKQVQSLMYQNQQLLKVQQDAQLRTKYANYDPGVVDKVTEDLVNNRIQATREDLFKVIDYENAVQRAYQLGKQDRAMENQEKVQGMTYQVGQTQTPQSSLQREKGETVQQFMQRSYAEHSKRK